MIRIERFVFNPFAENTYVAWDVATGRCVVVDAGNYNPADNRTLMDFIEKNDLKPVMAINTHGHVDHILGVPFVTGQWGVPFALCPADRFLIDSCTDQARMFGFTMSETPVVAHDLRDGDEIRLGDSTLKVIATPGHTPGHVCLLGEGVLFTGDTLFRESIGRTDLPGGDYSWIMRSILDKLLPLGPQVRIFPGHGAESTLGHESLYNPFITEVLGGEVCV